MKIFQQSWLKHVKMETGSQKNDSSTDSISQLKRFLSENKLQTNSDNSDKTLYTSDIGLNELALVVKEYEQLKEQYDSLQLEAQSKFKSTEAKFSKYQDEIDSLQQEKKRLNEELDTLKKNIQTTKSEKEELNTAFQKTIDRLDGEVKEQKKLCNEANEKLAAHDTAAKRAIMVIQKEMGAKIEQVTKLYQESLSEKDAQIIKIAKLESLIEETTQDKQILNKKISEQQSEIETVKTALKNKTSHLSKIANSSETQEKEVSKLNKKIETLQEEVKNQEIKVKWAQNKLKSELDAHKETKKQVAQLTGKLQQAKEEGDIIRKDCQQMIERYQGDEEIQSVRLNKELEQHIAKLKIQEEELSKQEEINKERLQAISIVNKLNDKLTKDIKQQQELVNTLGEKNKDLARQLGEQDKDYAEIKTSLEETKDKVKDFDDKLLKISELEGEIEKLKENEAQLKKQLQESELELSDYSQRHQEILQFSQNLTENNVSTKAAATDLQNKFDTVVEEKSELLQQLNSSKEESNKLIESLEGEKKQVEGELLTVKNKLEGSDEKVKNLTDSLEDSQEELRVLKKKNASQVKDLQRQLHQTTRKIEKMESTTNGSTENLSIRSRTSSCTSLERLHASESPPNVASPQLLHEPVMINQDHYISQPNRSQQHQQQNNTFPELEIDKNVLVERICKLQKALAKKNDKLEFLEEHVAQLTEEVQRKAKILQFHVLKQESGSIAPDLYDKVKAEACQHGGIMASVYSARPTDKNMTLDLSLAINKKLQAVLEDTILKNITLKENINTLGDEIAKLQVEVTKKT